MKESDDIIQESMFDDEDCRPEWMDHYVGMPEFVQEKQTCYAKLIVRFDCEDDLQEFAELIGQKLTNKSKSIWHPYQSHWGAIRMVYKDEE